MSQPGRYQQPEVRLGEGVWPAVISGVVVSTMFSFRNRTRGTGWSAISRILSLPDNRVENDHLSSLCVAAEIKRSTRTLGGPPHDVFCLILHRMGFTEPSVSPRPLVVSYSTLSPLPLIQRRSTFCGTSLRITPSGCYPPSCPVVSGLSSTYVAIIRRSIPNFLF